MEDTIPEYGPFDLGKGISVGIDIGSILKGTIFYKKKKQDSVFGGNLEEIGEKVSNYLINKGFKEISEDSKEKIYQGLVKIHYNQLINEREMRN